MTEPAWSYSDDLRIVSFLSGVAMVLFGIGLLFVLLIGIDGAPTADVFLGIGIFVLLFTALLVTPRIRSRGPRSFSLLVECSMDEAESAVKAALQGYGRSFQVQVARSRYRRPPRTIAVDGIYERFLLRAASEREQGRDSLPWTEIVAFGKDVERDEEARALRERIAARLAAPPMAND
ncbi:MAG TPA: hypothetical protein VIB49_10385 [Thermoplasmata archaeon]|jgi:hypothetical protein